LSRAGIEIHARLGPTDAVLRSPLVGSFNVENVLAAAAAGVALGLPAGAVVAGLAGVASVPGRLEKVSRDGEPLVLVDYAHTPDALVKALAAARALTPAPGRVLCVFGCGGDRDPGKRAPMGEAAGSAADRAWLTNDNPRNEDPAQIAAAVEVGLRRVSASYHIELDRAAAIAAAVAAATPGDAVLIAGKGHEDYQIIGAERRHFDDREVARSALDHAGRAP
jgi:UDP-N-acetylmuramoyl-L-alanyl-D-glutamate--2,6-diaminopimelate ligase